LFPPSRVYVHESFVSLISKLFFLIFHIKKLVLLSYFRDTQMYYINDWFSSCQTLFLGFLMCMYILWRIWCWYATAPKYTVHY
jgi:hypothetical protein